MPDKKVFTCPLCDSPIDRVIVNGTDVSMKLVREHEDEPLTFQVLIHEDNSVITLPTPGDKKEIEKWFGPLHTTSLYGAGHKVLSHEIHKYLLNPETSPHDLDFYCPKESCEGLITDTVMGTTSTSKDDEPDDLWSDEPSESDAESEDDAPWNLLPEEED